MNVKICGITNLEDALFAANCGAWAIGFNFYKKSPRYVSLETAKKICAQLPRNITKIGILIDCPEEEILSALTFLNLIQVYQCDAFSLPLLDKKRVILALQASSQDELPKSSVLQEYGYLLLDAPKQLDGLFGGTGRLANWDLARKIARDHRLVLAGGLNSRNITDAIKQVQPFAVDVASGVEMSPGIKNQAAVTEFLMRSKYVN